MKSIMVHKKIVEHRIENFILTQGFELVLVLSVNFTHNF